MAIQLQESRQIVTNKQSYKALIKIPYILREQTENKAEIEVIIKGFQPTIKDIIHALIEVYPLVKGYFLDSKGEIPIFVSYYLNSINLKKLDNLETRLSGIENVIEIRAGIAGG